METILLVDDEAIVRDVLREILKMEGYAVLEASSGREALQVYDQHEDAIDLLVTDIRMSGMDGGELAGRVAERHPGLPVLFISGYTDHPFVQIAMHDPHNAFLAKPIPADDLVRQVRELLAEAQGVHRR